MQFAFPKQCQKCLQELKKERCGDECVTFKFKLIVDKEKEFAKRPLTKKISQSLKHNLDKLPTHTILK